MDWEQHVIDATTEVFSTMLMMEVTPELPRLETIEPFDHSITGMVGMAGQYKGMLAIHACDQVAMAITSNFLGLEVDSLNDDVKDAFGELANMLAGSIKAYLSDNSRDIQLSIPSAVCGQNYSIDFHPHRRSTMVPFTSAEGTFLVELQLEHQS